MKLLLIAEYREKELQPNYKELVTYAERMGDQALLFAVGYNSNLPEFKGKLYLGNAETHGEYNPLSHKKLLLEVIEKEQPDCIVFSHSSYGWDLAPRIASSLEIPQISEIVDIKDCLPVVPVCNGKMRRTVRPAKGTYVATLQAGAFMPADDANDSPEVIQIDLTEDSKITFLGYELAEKGGVDLTKAEVIVSAGRGVGKPENIPMIAQLAEKLGGEYGASRPVVDAEWVEHNRQVGTTGQTVSPKLYVACGISGAIQHLAGMKKSEFVVAINTDKDAPIGEVADILAVSDVKQLIPALMERL